jgi:adenylate cyclase, class 1
VTTAAVNDEPGLGRKALQRIVGRFDTLAVQRLRRIRQSLCHEQQAFFDLLPLLWHVNHPTLPGFVSSNAPCGVVGYRPGRLETLLARRFVRGFNSEGRLRHQAPVRGIYLMGSMGSLGQTAGSDMDIWLCHGSDLGAAERAALRDKARLLEQHAAGIGLHAHFFVMNDAAFRDGETESLSKESSGGTQHTLLLEEFYRTGLRLAGSPLLWWIVPPEHERDYAAYTRGLVHKRFIKADQWLDFGGLDELPAAEFFGVAHWQLFKGIDAPYKSLLKLMLLEAYAAEYPHIQWLCLDTKRAVYADREIDADDIDPYVLIVERIARYLSQRNEPERLQLARRAFYFKTGQQLSQAAPREDWRTRLMRVQAQRWRLGRRELELLDSRGRWKLQRVVEERNALVSELSRSYRLLTDFARELAAQEAFDTRDLVLLGRKLYAALDKRPGKIERVNPGISRDLSEKTLWLRRSDDVPARWQLFLEAPDKADGTPVKSCISLVEILTWLHLNGICERATRIHYLPKPGGYGEPEPERIRKTLRKRLAVAQPCEADLGAYAGMAHGRLSIWFVNVGHDPLASLADAGYQLISDRSDALSYGSAHQNLVGNIEHLYVTSWHEVRIERYDDPDHGLLDCLCRYLDVFAPHDHGPRPIEAFSYSTPRGDTIARRVTQLVLAVAQAFHAVGPATRYLLRTGDSFYQVSRRDERYAWEEIGGPDRLGRILGRPRARHHPTRIDGNSLPGSPLPLLLQRDEPDMIQVFYLVGEQGIRLYVFDEQGAVFEQWCPGADERYLVTQLQRFLDTAASRRLLNGQAPAGSARFARVVQVRPGDWQVEAVRVPPSRVTDHTGLVLVVGPDSRLEQGFRLHLGEREFDSLLLGDRIYRDVVDQVRRLRRHEGDYPVYLTGVVGADGDAGGACHLIDLLQLKREVEQSLAEA